MRASERDGIRWKERECMDRDTFKTVCASKDLVGEEILATDSIVSGHNLGITSSFSTLSCLSVCLSHSPTCPPPPPPPQNPTPKPSLIPLTSSSILPSWASLH